MMMDIEIYNFFKVWTTTLIAIIYSYYIPSNIHPGKIRLASILPIIILFIYLPLNLNSVILGGGVAFFLTWMANFKLVLYAFNQGPLSSNLTVANFICIACLPIKVRDISFRRKEKSLLNMAVKGLVLAMLSLAWDHTQNIHPKVMLLYYCLFLYIGLELFLALSVALASILLGVQLESHFDEPYLSTSVQDFWGRRWNLMVTDILRPSVYQPVMTVASEFFGRKLSGLTAVLATFAVSGIMHEIMFYYLGRVKPSWEVTWFFIVQGVCVIIEVVVKKEVVKGKWQLHPMVSVPLTVGFVIFTSYWLFFPQMIGCNVDVRISREIGSFLNFF